AESVLRGSLSVAATPRPLRLPRPAPATRRVASFARLPGSPLPGVGVLPDVPVPIGRRRARGAPARAVPRIPRARRPVARARRRRSPGRPPAARARRRCAPARPPGARADRRSRRVLGDAQRGLALSGTRHPHGEAVARRARGTPARAPRTYSRARPP